MFEVKLDDIEVRADKYSFSWKGEGERAALADSIGKYGLLRPLVLVEEGEALIVAAGARRVEALRSVGVIEAPAIVAKVDMAKSAL